MLQKSYQVGCGKWTARATNSTVFFLSFGKKEEDSAQPCIVVAKREDNGAKGTRDGESSQGGASEKNGEENLISSYELYFKPFSLQLYVAKNGRLSSVSSTHETFHGLNEEAFGAVQTGLKAA